MTRVAGWDLGGANIKVATVLDGRIEQVAQIPCPICPAPSKFDDAVAAALSLLPAIDLHAVTMTGELSDVFTDRREGVAYLVGLMQRATTDVRLRIYASARGFLNPDAAIAHWSEVASANWHASAALAARHVADALFVDIGTTTTDLIPIKNGAVAARAHTDAERLAAGELVYTGVVRTPVMAIAQAAPFRGQAQRIAAERFAAMADIYRLAGDLPEDADPYPAADQRGKSTAESAARLARMLGRDASDGEPAEWTALARYFADRQLAMIEEAAGEVLNETRLGAMVPVIGAGCGRFLARDLAERLGRPYMDFAEMIDASPEAREMAARCAPAVSIALLAAAPEGEAI